MSLAWISGYDAKKSTASGTFRLPFFNDAMKIKSLLKNKASVMLHFIFRWTGSLSLVIAFWTSEVDVPLFSFVMVLSVKLDGIKSGTWDKWLKSILDFDALF